jgi:hypothetical protein
MASQLFKWVIALVALTTGAPAFARVGESQQKIEARYGKPVQCNKDKTGADLCVYKTTDFIVAVCLLKRISVSESYSTKAGGDLTAAQIEYLLGVNSSKKWHHARTLADGTETWVVKDLSIAAQYLQPKHVLSISTKRFLDLSTVAQTYEEIEKLKDF